MNGRHQQIATRIEAAERIETARRLGLENVAAESLRAGESATQFQTRLLRGLVEQLAANSTHTESPLQ